ncbi:MAG: P1 family peptidase [Acidimicrobiales bacterium]|nr:P1 family peptidase [Acidimicrobiales bacterium]
MLTDVPGVRVGHWTDEVARTGCTVVLLPTGTVASGEVRGGAPATREFALLDPQRLVDRADAVVLTGGSAFGLAAADGVMRFCEERGVGFPTIGGPVPIVVGLGLFDLGVGDPAVRPGPAEGYAACVAASAGPARLGQVGAGTGATVGKWRGREHARPGGLGAATVTRGALVVSALLAVNALGEPDDGTLHWLPGTEDHVFGNTTIGVIATNASLDKDGCLLVAQSGHDGLARALLPVHTLVDGDALVAAATAEVRADLDLVRLLAVRAVEAAVRDAVG